MYVCEYVRVSMGTYLPRTEAADPSGAGLAGGSESPDVGAGN